MRPRRIAGQRCESNGSLIAVQHLTTVTFLSKQPEPPLIDPLSCKINAGGRAARRICRVTFETTSIKSISPRSRAQRGSDYSKRFRAR